MPTDQEFKEARARIRAEINARPLTDFVQLETCKNGNTSFDNNRYACPVCSSGHRGGGDTAFMIYKDYRCICRSCNKFGGSKGEDTLGALRVIWECDEAEAMKRTGYKITDFINGNEKRAPAPITSPKQETKPKQKEPEKDLTDYILGAAARIESAEAVKYLSYRGISVETAKRFKLGYDGEWRNPKSIAEGKNPPSSPRLIVPTSRYSYLARDTRPDADPAYSKQKAGSIHFLNEKALYNPEGRPCFITEGEFDALAIEEAGSRACSIGGASNADEFAKQLKAKPTKNLLLVCPDNDEAGRTAGEKIKKALEDIGADFAVVNIAGTHKDANEALTADRAAFIAAVQDAERINAPEAQTITRFLKAVEGESYRPMPTGLTPFDNIIGGGLLRQTLVMLGAAPGMGKSFFAQQILENMAESGRSVLYYNLEMSETQMIARSLAREGHKKTRSTMAALDILQGYRWTPSQKSQVRKIAADYAERIGKNIRYNPAGSTAQLDDILTSATAAAESAVNVGKDAPLVCIDYLHLLRGREREDGQQVMKRAVDSFKDYAIRYNTVVILILAFNRESNKNAKVSQESGRDSSALEYSADLMLGLAYQKAETAGDTADIEKIRAEANKDMRNTKKGYTVYRLKVLKNRLQGSTGSIDMKFYGRYGYFIPDKDAETSMEAVDDLFPDGDERTI